MHWLIALLRSLFDMVRETTQAANRGPTLDAHSPHSIAFPTKRSMMGHLQSGLRKGEIIRRAAAIDQKYRRIEETIGVTRRTIKRTPRRSRYLFEGYLTLLDDVRRRAEMLYRQGRTANECLHRYDIHALEEEVAHLEAYLRNTGSARARAESEGTLEARRGLLDSVREAEETLSTIAAQMSYIAATLELNHTRVLTLSSRVAHGEGAGSGMIRERMEEITTQLSLLEESVRELDNGM